MCVIEDLFVNGAMIIGGSVVMWYVYNGAVPVISWLYHKSLNCNIDNVVRSSRNPNYNRRILMGDKINWCMEIDMNINGGEFNVELFAPHLIHMTVNEIERFLWTVERYDIGCLTHYDIMVLLSQVPIDNIPEGRKQHFNQYRFDHAACRHIGDDA